jgi:PadR family transcriptional regulator PadR
MGGPDVVAGPWLRGVLEPCLLALLADGEAYGYELANQLEARGIGRVVGGTLYPALLRLEEQGFVTTEWRAGVGGPGRKYYALTELGRGELAGSQQRWHAFSASVSRLLREGVRDGARR